jgi:hypothetical protein
VYSISNIFKHIYISLSGNSVQIVTANLLAIYITVFLPYPVQQHQDLKLNPFKIRHCSTCFGLLAHHQVRCNSGELLCLPRFPDRCFHIHNVSKWSQCSSSSYDTCVFFFGIPVSSLVCSVDVMSVAYLVCSVML